MSKVICDVCGTTYPETAAQCPICNSAKNSPERTAAAASGDGEKTTGYTPVKGGRFSKKNVRKRNRKGGSTAQRRSASKDESSNTGLVIVVILLLLAIAIVVVYIGMHFFAPGSNSGGNVDSTTTAPSQTQTETEQTQQTTLDTGIHCEALQLSNKIIELANEGDTWTLVVAVTPVDTTDSVSFQSSDEAVVTVSDSGVATAVGGGSAVITVTCGEITETCEVVCTFSDPEPSSEPDETTEVTGDFDFAFNTAYVDQTTGYGDATLTEQGKTWKAYKSSLTIDPSLITWTSDDTSVCTIENGVVTAVGPGKTLIHAQYNGVTYSCLIRCSFTVSGGSTTTDTDTSSTGSCTINKTDVTLSVGSSFTLTLKDADGNVLDVTWTASGDNVSISGNTITGVTAGKVTVSVTYDGVTYSCIVRVK